MPHSPKVDSGHLCKPFYNYLHRLGPTYERIRPAKPSDREHFSAFVVVPVVPLWQRIEVVLREHFVRWHTPFLL